MENESQQMAAFAVKKSLEASATAHVSFMALAFLLKQASQQAPELRHFFSENLQRFFDAHPAPSDATVHDVEFSRALDDAIGALLSLLREK